MTWTRAQTFLGLLGCAQLDLGNVLINHKERGTL